MSDTRPHGSDQPGPLQTQPRRQGDGNRAVALGDVEVVDANGMLFDPHLTEAGRSMIVLSDL
ncbi:hypothetical protein D3C84_1149770 [compost metagenome]